MASVLGVARLLKLPVEKITHALNLTVAANVALYQTRIGNVSMWKGCAYANSSRNAIFAAQMAARGMTGPSPVFEGRGGYFKAVTHGPVELAPFGDETERRSEHLGTPDGGQMKCSDRVDPRSGESPLRHRT